jgi:type I site-specific restriction endonuclease
MPVTKKVTLDDVWATMRELQELNKKVQEAHRETEKAIEKMSARVDITTENINKMGARVDMTTENVDKMSARVDRIAKNVGGLNQSVREIVEILIASHLWEKFPEYDLKRVFRRLRLYDDKNEEKAEIDILLVNTEWAMAVEVKTELAIKEVDRHIERMKRIIKYPPAEIKIRPGIKLLGACAGGIVTPEAREAAHEAGFFVLELTDEAVTRIPEPADFKPKEW